MTTIELIQQHHSVRQFSTQSIEPTTLNTLIASAQAAATAHYVQAYSIISITDNELKQKLASISGQEHALNNAHLLVFIADLNRHASLLNPVPDTLGSIENLVIALTDAALAAQNLTLAAESLGLGCCYLGSLRNQVGELIRLLNLPRYTFPLFGIALGYPARDADMEQKPRLPLAEIHMYNGYHSEARQQHLSAFDGQVQAYYAERVRGQRIEQWTTQMRQFFSKVRRADMSEHLKAQGFLL